MCYLKQGAKYLALALLMVLVLSITAAANTSSVEYILYERSDGNYILVNYEDALNLFQDGSLSQKKLYQKTVEDVQVALANFRDVFVSTSDGNVIDYGKAVDDGKELSDVIGDSDYEADDVYNTVAKLYDQAYRKMMLDGNTIVLRRPAQDDAPDGIEIYVVKSELAASYFVNVKIDASDFEMINTIGEVDAVEILGRNAASRGAEGDVNIWRIRLSNDPLEQLGVNELTTKHFRVRVDGRWLW